MVASFFISEGLLGCILPSLIIQQALVLTAPIPKLMQIANFQIFFVLVFPLWLTSIPCALHLKQKTPIFFLNLVYCKMKGTKKFFEVLICLDLDIFVIYEVLHHAFNLFPSRQISWVVGHLQPSGWENPNYIPVWLQCELFRLMKFLEGAFDLNIDMLSILCCERILEFRTTSLQL